MNVTKIVAGALAAGCIAGLSACTRAAGAAADSKGGDSAAANRVVPVVSTLVAQRDVPIALDGLGNVTAYNTVTVRSQVDGRLEQVLFHEGQAVQRGQLLAQIDPRPFQIQLHQAEGALARDEATLKDNQLNLERNKDLRAKNLVSAQVLDDQTALVGQLEGAIQVDKAAIEGAKLNLDYARITSPIDGITGVRQVDAGNLIHASDATGIVIVTQLDPISVFVTLPEDALPSIAPEQLKAPLLVDAFSRDGVNHLAAGKLLVIDNQINQATATLRLKAVFPNPQHVLWPNQFVKARVVLSVQKNALVIPATAVQRGPDGTFVYVVGADQTVTVRPVDVDRSQGDLTIIAKGLEAGEQVVTDGQTQLRAGSKVKARLVSAAPPAYAEQGPGGRAKPEKAQ